MSITSDNSSDSNLSTHSRVEDLFRISKKTLKRCNSGNNVANKELFLDKLSDISET